MNLFEEGIFLFMDNITSETVRPILEWILLENMRPEQDKRKKLTLIMESDGGELSATWCVIDAIRGSQIPIHTIGIGTIASGAFMIFITGDHRVLTPNTSILSHQYSNGETSMKQHELLAVTKEYELLDERMVQHYKRCLKLSVKKIKELLLPPHDIWLSADEALELGVCDEVKDL